MSLQLSPEMSEWVFYTFAAFIVSAFLPAAVAAFTGWWRRMRF